MIPTLFCIDSVMFLVGGILVRSGGSGVEWQSGGVFESPWFLVTTSFCFVFAASPLQPHNTRVNAAHPLPLCTVELRAALLWIGWSV
jgi:hypothetical protein